VRLSRLLFTLIFLLAPGLTAPVQAQDAPTGSSPTSIGQYFRATFGALQGGAQN